MGLRLFPTAFAQLPAVRACKQLAPVCAPQLPRRRRAMFEGRTPAACFLFELLLLALVPHEEERAGPCPWKLTVTLLVLHHKTIELSIVSTLILSLCFFYYKPMSLFSLFKMTFAIESSSTAPNQTQQKPSVSPSTSF